MVEGERPVWAPQNPLAVSMPSAESSGVYLRIDDNVRITSFNAAAGVTLACRSRMLDLQGGIQVSNDLQTPNTDRTAKSSIFSSDEGWVLGGSVVVTAGAPLDGQCFVVVEIVRGQGTAALALEQIAAGYVTAKQPLRFPSLSTIRSIDGGGALRSITGAVPGAGAEISETVPTGARWELLALTMTLTTSATVANRLPTVTIDDGALVYFRQSAMIVLAQSLNLAFQWAEGTPSFTLATNGLPAAPLPVNNRLGAGHRIRTSTAAIAVGDQYSLIQYLVREWIEGA